MGKRTEPMIRDELGPSEDLCDACGHRRDEHEHPVSSAAPRCLGGERYCPCQGFAPGDETYSILDRV